MLSSTKAFIPTLSENCVHFEPRHRFRRYSTAQSDHPSHPNCARAPLTRVIPAALSAAPANVVSARPEASLPRRAPLFSGVIYTNRILEHSSYRSLGCSKIVTLSQSPTRVDPASKSLLHERLERNCCAVRHVPQPGGSASS